MKAPVAWILVVPYAMGVSILDTDPPGVSDIVRKTRAINPIRNVGNMRQEALVIIKELNASGGRT